MELVLDIPALGIFRAQKFAAGRHVVKKRAHLHLRPGRFAGGNLTSHDFGKEADPAHRRFDVRSLRFDFQNKDRQLRRARPRSAAVDLARSNRSLEITMIDVTQNAARQLRHLLDAQKQTAGKGLRVQIMKGGCSGLHYEMTLDEKKTGDAVVERDGVEFFIDNESASYLRGATLDFRDGLTGTGFQIVNQNASRTCGCGTSFEATPSA